MLLAEKQACRVAAVMAMVMVAAVNGGPWSVNHVACAYWTLVEVRRPHVLLARFDMAFGSSLGT